MTSRNRLMSVNRIAPDIRLPAYNSAAHGRGIVHLGVGAFHRAHQAVYTDDALAAAGGDWRITGVSLRGTSAADALNPQNGLFTLLERSGEGTKARIIASIDQVIAATRDHSAVIAAMINPATRIVSLTVTEKAYGIDRLAGCVDIHHQMIAADLANPRKPAGVLGFLVETLRLRRLAGVAPYTVLCCDNLPDNGALLKTGTIEFARRIDPELGMWIKANVAFPSTMVDRITPAATEVTFDEAALLTGCIDLAAIETESFSQWVIEDRFPLGRPQWESGGAIFVDDVAPYERMKLRMLNGSHSMLAYAGFLAGHKYVRDVMADHEHAKLVKHHLNAAAATLDPLSEISLENYAGELVARFQNPAIAHETYQIAMDGTEKLPQRIIQPALDALQNGLDIRPFAFAVAVWMRYCLGRTDDGKVYAIRDPRQEQIEQAVKDSRSAEDISSALHGLAGLFPQSLAQNSCWRSTVASILDEMMRCGVKAAIETEARANRDDKH